MTLPYSHDVRLHASAGATRYTLRRAIRQIGLAFTAIHRAIATAKIHRLRNELLLHRGQEGWAGMDLYVGQDAAKYPRSPVVLGEKWDY